MDESDFEGSLVLEKLEIHDLLEEFFEAIDADDYGKASQLMKMACIDSESIAVVLKKMSEADNNH